MNLVFQSMSLRWFLKNPVAMLCLIFLTFVIVAAIVGPWLTGYGYEQTSNAQFNSPSWTHWFGTDLHGRDLLTRVLCGAQISLTVGLIGAFVSLSVGVSYGMVSGYLGGRIDGVMMRIVDVLYSLPRLIYVIVLIAVLDKWLYKTLASLGVEILLPSARILLLFVGIGAVQWLTMARIVRGQVLSLKEQQFVLAAKAIGARKRRILIRHILPNLVGIIIVYLTLTIPEVILLESFLSFLGLGIQPPQSSWGSLIADGAGAVNPVVSRWWLIVFPGIMMAVTLLTLNLLGDRLSDFFDPRTQPL